MKRTGLPTYVQGLTSDVAHTLKSLPALAFLSLFFLGLLAFQAHGAVSYYQDSGEQTAFVTARFLRWWILALLYLSLAVLVVTLVQELVFKFQVLFAFVSWIQGTILVGSLLMTFIVVVASTYTAAEDPGGFEPYTFVVVSVVGLMLILIATCVHMVDSTGCRNTSIVEVRDG